MIPLYAVVLAMGFLFGATMGLWGMLISCPNAFFLGFFWDEIWETTVGRRR